MLSILSIGQFLLKNWKIGIMVLLGLYIGWLKLVNTHLENKVLEEQAKYSELQIAHDLCEQGRKELKQAIQSINERVEAWEDISIELSAENEKLKTSLVEQQQATEQTVIEILNRPTPKSCEEAINFLKQKEDLKW